MINREAGGDAELLMEQRQQNREQDAPTLDQGQAGLGAAPPPESGGSQAPPADAGDAPDRQFPVPPVPPPPAPGPIFSLAGGGGGGAASFARPGTAAAKPFRSPIFTANRSTAAPGVGARFGSGTAVTAGGAGSPGFMPAGLADEGGGGPAAGDELRRILALMGGGRG